MSHYHHMSAPHGTLTAGILQPQLRNLGWGISGDGRVAEIMILTRCDGVVELGKLRPQSILKLKQAYEIDSQRSIVAYQQKISRIKDEIELLRARLCRTRREIRLLNPVLRAVPLLIKIKDKMVPMGIQSACPGFGESCSPRRLLGPFDLSPPETCALDDELNGDVEDEDNPESELVTKWIDQRLKSMVLYGKELGFDEEESDSEDESDYDILDGALEASKLSAVATLECSSEEYEGKLRLRELEGQRLALTAMISRRESVFASCKMAMKRAIAFQMNMRTKLNYLHRLKQLSTEMAINGTHRPDLLGEAGPVKFDWKLSARADRATHSSSTI